MAAYTSAGRGLVKQDVLPLDALVTLVTFITSDLYVRSLEREICPGLMIEERGLPTV